MKDVDEVTKMGFNLKCPMSGCGSEINADNKEQLMSKVLDHAKAAHNLSSIPPDMMAKINAATATMGLKKPF